ncbi:MAG TPA: DUF4129 domain-containing protein, partial [Pilimelia sp.]|nr:DUF4129 domain-containing protein [Pilimelia sp.]
LVGADQPGGAWYHYPAWVPRRLPRWRGLRPRWRRRRRSRAAQLAEPATPEPATPEAAGESLPDLPADAFRSRADDLAAQGRYAEAVRERLRAMVRELVDRGVVAHQAGLTITELADAAGRRRPAVQPPLRAAGGVFTELWYAERAATAGHDARMRQLADELRRALEATPREAAR